MRVAYAVDWDKHACETHRENAPDTVVRCGDVALVTRDEIESAAGCPVDLLAGGPNCQGLSQLGLRSPDDPRSYMLQEFARLVSELKPRAFLFENVPGLGHRYNFSETGARRSWMPRGSSYRSTARCTPGRPENRTPRSRQPVPMFPRAIRSRRTRPPAS